MGTCTIWPLCEISGSHIFVIENSGLRGDDDDDDRSGIENRSVTPTTTTQIFMTLTSLLVKLLSDLVKGIQNTAFCHDNEIQSKRAPNKC
jgi:hypothetical protein